MQQCHSYPLLLALLHYCNLRLLLLADRIYHALLKSLQLRIELLIHILEGIEHDAILMSHPLGRLVHRLKLRAGGTSFTC